MNKLGRLPFIVLLAIVAVTVILLISLMTNISPVDSDPKMNMWVDYNLYWTYALLILGVGIILVYGLFQLISDFKSAKGMLVGVGFIAAVILIAYLLSSGEIPQFPGVQKFVDNHTLTPSVSKWVDTGLITTYLLLGFAILSVAYASVSKLFSK